MKIGSKIAEIIFEYCEHTVSEACDCKRNNQDWVRWVQRKNDVSYQATAWRKHSNASLAKSHMDTIVKESCDTVAQERRQENQRDNCVSKLII